MFIWSFYSFIKHFFAHNFLAFISKIASFFINYQNQCWCIKILKDFIFSHSTVIFKLLSIFHNLIDYLDNCSAWIHFLLRFLSIILSVSAFSVLFLFTTWMLTTIINTKIPSVFIATSWIDPIIPFQFKWFLIFMIEFSYFCVILHFYLIIP
jgi:hypothetical protein